MSSDKLDFIAEWIRAEEARPSRQSRDIVQKLRELADLCDGRAPAKTEDPRLRRARELMQTALSEPWTVALLAKAAGMSRAQFARRFTAAIGTSPREYLHEQRMTRARALLAVTDDSLADVAGAVGYASEFAFNRAFRRHFGVPPGAYRRLVSQGPVGSVVCLRRAG
jgi:transcriptional regulator GlxA family with amidase domain